MSLAKVCAVLSQTWGNARFWRAAAAVLATAAAALLVAALVERAPPDFARRPVITVLRDGGQHAGWSVRLARHAHQIAVDALGPRNPPAGKAYQLWLIARGTAAQPLGLLPIKGRKIIPATPANVLRLAGRGELAVTLELGNGGLAAVPSGPPLYRGNFDDPG